MYNPRSHMTKTKNEVLKTIADRHSTRQFSSEPVSDEQLKLILNAANQAPSAHNQQSWRFIVLAGDKKKGLASLIASKAEQFPRASAALLRMASRSITSAPVVIAISNTGELIHHGTQLFQIDSKLSDDFFRTMEIQSSSAAVENLLIAATSLGLASVWLGIMFLIKDEILEYLNEPKGEFMAIIAVGHPEKHGISPQKRPLEKIARFVE
jgi:nitroreductase